MGPGITFDDSLWPLLISHFRGTVPDAAFETYLDRSAEYLRRGELYVNVADMGRLKLPSAEQRQLQLDWMRREERALRAQLIGCAFVVSSPLMRLALSTMIHGVPQHVPYVVMPDLPEAARWASQRLDDRGLSEAARRVRQRYGMPHARS